ncbi:MlaD family protein [Nocardia sp. NPDC059246]|uniref:MlaD family protein n=1 Tax=unclassified Nocardia TaxID=2637762 RepID=UPI003679DCE5
MINRTAVSVLGMAVIAASSFVYMNHLGLQTGAFEHTKTAMMAVSDTNGLVAGSRVLLRGVAIGTVTDVDTSADHIEVALKYDDGYHIPAGSRFRIDNLSALGETYLAVQPDSDAGPYLADHATIDTKQIVVPTTFKELSARLTRLLEQVDPQRVQDIFHMLDVALPDDSRVLGDLNHAGELLASTITQQSGNLTTLLKAMQPLLLQSDSVPGDLAGAAPDMVGFAQGLTDVIEGMHFAVDFGPLRDGIKYGASPFLDDLQGFLDKSAGDLQVLGVDLLPGVRAGAAAMRTVNLGQVLDNALAATASGDALAIHVQIPGR